jgi:hypothetical protein
MATNQNKAALIKLTEERINTNEQLVSFVERAKAVTIPLFPETVQFTDTALKYGAAIVTVDTTLDNYGNNRDVYKNESGGYCLHLSKLNEIAQQAGIQITDSRILERKTDERGRVTFIEHQVRGRLKSVDGSVKEDVATGKYDYFRDQEKYTSEKQVKSRRSHAEALAESNAKTRLFNKLVAKLSSSFTLEELKKPFLIPYVIEDKDALLAGLPVEDQLSIKKEVARKRLGLVDAIYAPPQGYEQSKGEQIQDAEVITETITEEKKPLLSPEEQNHNAALTYKDAPQKERTEKILNLIKIKDFKDPNGTAFTAARIEKASVDDQVKFIEKLLNLPDPEEGLPV